MNVDAYMVAIGEEHTRLAAVTRPIAERALSARVRLITEGSPYAAKLRALASAKEGRCVLIIDADAVLSSWDWSAIDFGRVNAVRLESRLLAARNRDVVPEGWPLLHTGVVLSPYIAAPAASLAERLMRVEFAGRRWTSRDEVPYSAALYRCGLRANLLPQSAVTLVAADRCERVPCAHFVGPNKLRRLLEYVETHRLAC